MNLMLPLYALIGAMAFRTRGGAFPSLTITTLGARTLYALTMAVLLTASVAPVATPLWLILLAGLGFLLGSMPGWDGSLVPQGMGNYLYLVARGAWFAILPAMALLWLTGDIAGAFLIVIGAALLCPLAYGLGPRIPLHFNRLRQGPEVSEALFGAALGILVALA